MPDKKIFSKPVSLKWLKVANISTSPYYSLILKDDVWINKTLLIKKGGELNQHVIAKLIQFGIEETKVDLIEKDYADFDSPNLIKNQCALIIQKDFKSVAKHAKMLINIGFDNKNIFVSNHIKYLSNYLHNKSLCYLFIEFSLFTPKAINIIKHSTYKRCLDVFLLNTPQFVENNLISSVCDDNHQIYIKCVKKELNLTAMKAIVATSQNSKYKNLMDKKVDIERQNNLIL